jgi:hypothetical protein
MELVKDKSNDNDETYTIDLNDDMSLSFDKKTKAISIMDINELLTLNIPNITSFTLDNEILSDIGCILLRDALIKNTTITCIDISCCNINDIQAIIVSDVINSDYIKNGKGNKTITNFTIMIDDTSKISKIGIKALLQALNKNNFIEDFTLSQLGKYAHICDIEEVDLLSNIIDSNNKLLRLDISRVINFSQYNNDYDSLINANIILDRFSNSLKNNKTLRTLVINHCFPNKSILNGIQNNISIKHLDLYSNEFSYKEIEALVDILKFNKSLEYLDISECFNFSELKTFLEKGVQDSTIINIAIIEDTSYSSLYDDLDNWYSKAIYIDEITGLPINNSDIEIMLNLLSKYKYINTNIFRLLLNTRCNDLITYFSNDNEKTLLDNKQIILQKYSKIMENNRKLYKNAFWNPYEHLFFGGIQHYHNNYYYECHQLVMTSLICNSYLRYNLSIYIWQYIFSFYQRKQF